MGFSEEMKTNQSKSTLVHVESNRQLLYVSNTVLNKTVLLNVKLQSRDPDPILAPP